MPDASSTPPTPSSPEPASSPAPSSAPSPATSSSSGPRETRCVDVASVPIGRNRPLVIIAGPCLAESESLCMRVGEVVKRTCDELGLGFIFKASFDKANRSSIRSDRGPGLDQGLRMLAKVHSDLGVPTTTDIHEPLQAQPASQAVQLLQIPAFLCRQTDLLVAAGQTGLPVNAKKGQFLSPGEMSSVVEKLCDSGCSKSGVMLTERGTFFGYGRLVNDFLGLGDMMDLGWPVCFDVTHSTQLPGAGQTSGNRVTAGRPDRAALLAQAAVAAGVDALFMEVHPDPSQARSDGATMLPLDHVRPMLETLARIRDAVTHQK